MNEDRELTVDIIIAEQFHACKWSDKSRHPDDALKIGYLLKEIRRLRDVIKDVKAAVGSEK